MKAKFVFSVALILTICSLMGFGQDTIVFSNLTLNKFKYVNLTTDSTLNNYSCLFANAKDTLTINYKAVYFNFFPNCNCNLIVKHTYSFKLIKICWSFESKKIDKWDVVYYNFVTFNRVNCAQFDPYSFSEGKFLSQCRKSYNHYGGGISTNNYVDYNNEVYKLIDLNPCEDGDKMLQH